MLRKSLISGLCLSLIAVLCLTPLMVAAADNTRVADAAMKGDRAAVRSLLKQAEDVNAAQGDGMTALHWAASNGDAELVQMLLYAGANLRATTRLGAYTPLFMASKSGHASVIDVLLKAGADPKSTAVTGLTPLMMAASSGNAEAVRLLVEHGADVNARESEHGQTALAFAAAFDRPDAIKVLLMHRADVNLSSNVIQPPQLKPVNAASAAGQRGGQAQNQAQGQAQRQGQNNNAGDADANAKKFGGNPKGSLTALMYAARQGNINAARALLDGGANINAVSADKSTALLLATINGRFDAAKLLVERGADLNLANLDGAFPLYGVVNTQWTRKSIYSQPTTKYEKTGYLELMKVMLDHGANPNARVTRDLWFAHREIDPGVEFVTSAGATAFWKCAEVGDVDGMRLLVAHGADPNIGNSDGVTPLMMAAGSGWHGMDDVTSPHGRFAAVKYLVEELHADVNATDTGGSRLPGYTPLHNAAHRGDNEMILYLVSKGARVDAVSRNKMTVADMANGPRERVQPYPETVALLEMLGSRNNHKCVSC
jgi:ankyrin repeat protein